VTKKVVAVIKVTLGKARGRVQRGRGVVESDADLVPQNCVRQG
jgi:hypothetical protein